MIEIAPNFTLTNYLQLPLTPVELTKDYVIEQAKEQNKIHFPPARHPPSKDEIEQLHTEPASTYPTQIPHLKVDCCQTDTDLFSTTLNHIVTSHQPQFSPDTHLYSTNMHDNHCAYGARSRNHSPPLPTMPSHAPQYPPKTNQT